MGSAACLGNCYLPGGNSASSLGVCADWLGIIIILVRTTYNLTACLGRTNYIIGINCLGGTALAPWESVLTVWEPSLPPGKQCCLPGSCCLPWGTALAPWELAPTAWGPVLPAWETVLPPSELLPALRDSSNYLGVSAGCRGTTY